MKHRNKSVTPGQRIKQLKEQLRRSQDDIEREGIQQAIEHWNRVSAYRKSRDGLAKQ